MAIREDSHHHSSASALPEAGWNSPPLLMSLTKQKMCTQEEPNPSPWVSAASGKAMEESEFCFHADWCHGVISTDPQQEVQQILSSKPPKHVVASCANRI